MFEFLRDLFDTSDFPARWYCGNWTAGHGWLHILSDLGVWSAYLAIPCVLGYFVLRRRDIPFRGIFLLFGAFILACGATHLMEALIFWWPAYRLAGVIKLVTAIVSWATVIALVPVVPKVLAMRSPEELAREIGARMAAENAMHREAVARRDAEQQAALIWEQRERLRVTLDSIGDAVIAIDAGTRVTLMNPVARSLTGWGDEAANRPLDEIFRIVNQQSRQPVESPVGRVLREGTVVGLANHTVLIAKDGSERSIDDSAAPIKNERGEIIGVVLVFRDVTEKGAAEIALRASEERWRTLTEALPNLVWTDLPDGQCDWLSSQWGKYTGIPENELLGLRWLETVIHPDDRQRTLDCWNAACADKGDYDLEYRIRRYDGEYHWFKTRGVPIRDEHGKIVRWFGTCTDIEDFKRLEAALREADRRKNEFLAILAHELRNPLAPIRNGLQILRMADERQIRDTAREMMERQLGQMVRLVDDLLDISRISQNKLELRKARIALTSVVENAVETARPLIESKGHALTVTLPPLPVYLDADMTRLSQVVWNLLNNSAKYTDPGGKIDLIAEDDGRQVILKVRDNGIGIPAEHQSRLFEIFSQVDHGIERSQGGLGIGLALVKGLVEMHGGAVEIKSAGMGKGSEFVVRLPLAPTEQKGEKAPSGEWNTISPGRRILVVDDNRDAAASLVMMLSLLGHETRMAHDGVEAVELAEAFRPDVVLLDIGLPKLNGYDACRRIRQKPWGQSVVIIAATGWGQEQDRRRSHEAGFSYHLVKPVDPVALEKLIASVNPAPMR